MTTVVAIVVAVAVGCAVPRNARRDQTIEEKVIHITFALLSPRDPVTDRP